jgi:hypothetical protein
MRNVLSLWSCHHLHIRRSLVPPSAVRYADERTVLNMNSLSRLTTLPSHEARQSHHTTASWSVRNSSPARCLIHQSCFALLLYVSRHQHSIAHPSFCSAILPALSLTGTSSHRFDRKASIRPRTPLGDVHRRGACYLVEVHRCGSIGGL